MDSQIIRLATLEDFQCMAELSVELGYLTTPEQSKLRMIEILNSTDHAVFLASTSENKLVGWIHVFQAYRIESDTFAEIGGFIVTRDQRGQGLGRSLLDAAEKWTQERGLAKLRVRTNRLRTEALLFYDRMGFQPKKEQCIYDKTLE